MNDTRFKDQTFDLSGEKSGHIRSWDAVAIAALYDLRDELRRINELLGCYKIQRMFQTINRLDRRLQKKFPLKPKGGHSK